MQRRTGRSRDRSVPGRVVDQNTRAGRWQWATAGYRRHTRQANDSRARPKPLARLRLPRDGPARSRTRPQTVRADKGLLAPRAHRVMLRSRGITAVIRESLDQIGHRKNIGSCGGRRVNFDADDYKNPNVVERASTTSRTGDARPPATTHASVYRGGVVRARSCSGCHHFRDTP